MVEYIRALVLGLVQGLTEFLPVSSSGHLEIAKFLLNDNQLASESLLETVVLHFATALSTVVIFRKEIISIITGFLTNGPKGEGKYGLLILLSMIPAACIGVFFNDIIETLFDRNILLVGLMLLITGLILVTADRAKTNGRELTIGSALLIGVAQAVAILPGISRSGATIGMALLSGHKREEVAKFSFLMVIPLIFGKVAKDLIDGGFSLDSFNPPALFLSFLAAFISGWWACRWMIKMVANAKLKYFGYYCFLAGSISLLLTIL
jgi:undecaprenyl-diphosphatase